MLLRDLLEIGSAFENHAAYLQHWVRLLRESPEVLFQVLGEARQAVKLVAPEPGMGATLSPTRLGPAQLCDPAAQPP